MIRKIILIIYIYIKWFYYVLYYKIFGIPNKYLKDKSKKYDDL